MQLVLDCLRKLDADNLRINLPKCHFAKQQISWLGYNITQSGISPLESKTSSIISLQPPNTLKKLRSFLGSVHYISKFIPNLAQLCHPLRPLLRKSTKYVWTDTHTLHFNAIKTRIANHTENMHYNPQFETRIKCDASRSGLGAALEQLTVDGWKPISFASRFLNSSEECYSINELELLGVVWSIEYFKNYLYGKEFTVITNHRAFNSRLARWVDRLLPYQFSIEHLPGAKMGLVDYISRNPYQPAKSVSKYDEEFLVATLSSIHTDAQLLQQKHNLTANSLHKFYIDIDREHKNSTTITEQVLTIDYVTQNPQSEFSDSLALRNNSSKYYSKQYSFPGIKPAQRVRLTNVKSNFAPRINSLKFSPKQTSNLDMNPAQHVRLTNNSSHLASQKHNSNIIPFKFKHMYSTHAPDVHLAHKNNSFADQMRHIFIPSTNGINCTSVHDQRVHFSQNIFVLANTYSPLKVNTSNLIDTTPNLASRVRKSFNKLTPAWHNPLLVTQKTKMHSLDDSFATRVTKYPNHSKYASHSLPFTTTPVQIESQRLVNTRKASLAHQNTSKFTPLSHSHLSIKNQPQIPTFFSKPHSNTLNNSRAQLVNKNQVLFAQTQSEIQLPSFSSINLIEKTKISSTMSQQASSLKGKSLSTRSTRASPRVSFTDNATTSTPRRSSSHSNLSTPLTDSPQVMSFERVVGKVFSKGLIALLTSKDAVLKEVRDCIIRGG